jgi:alpha-D-ribose 1-methylphosphonate 5-triphosphate synthase subunit PhnH
MTVSICQRNMTIRASHWQMTSSLGIQEATIASLVTLADEDTIDWSVETLGLD